MKLHQFVTFIVYPLVAFFLTFYLIHNVEDPVLIVPFIFVPIVIAGFNFMIRKNLELKPYFTSKYNFLTSKYRSTISSELSKDLMYQKMVEVVQLSDVKLIHAKDSTLEILGIKGITFSSWGENIYIDFTESNGQTQMNFVSTTVIGMISWGKNEKNYNRLLSNFEESLTI